MVMTLRECHEGMKDLARHLMAELGALTPMIVGFEKYTDRRWVFAVSVASPEERRMSIDETRDRLAEHNCDRYSMIDADRLIAALPELLVLGVLSTGVAYALQAVAQQFTSASEAAVLASAESVFGAGRHAPACRATDPGDGPRRELDRACHPRHPVPGVAAGRDIARSASAAVNGA